MDELHAQVECTPHTLISGTPPSFLTEDSVPGSRYVLGRWQQTVVPREEGIPQAVKIYNLERVLLQTKAWSALCDLMIWDSVFCTQFLFLGARGEVPGGSKEIRHFGTIQLSAVTITPMRKLEGYQIVTKPTKTA
jgi:hypothetical protein